MSGVTIKSLCKEFKGDPPVRPIDVLDMEIPEGEFLVLLGPSGCGKTTTLRSLAGLESPDAGSITIGDRVVFDASTRTNLPPEKRNVGMVFQSYALWPHMSVRKNIAYPLKSRKVKGHEIERIVQDTAALVDCSVLLDRFPGQLSGGQQQRVALARGLSGSPAVVLFDEPLSNLDARLRDLVRAQLHELHARLGFTAVFVTHDQSEALALGDRIAIMRSGRIEQIGPPEDIFESPATSYVAEFIGMANDLLVERSAAGDWTCRGVRLTGGAPATASRAHLRLRPEDLELSPVGSPVRDGAAAFDARVADSTFGGRHLDVALVVGGQRLAARVAVGERGGWTRSLERDALVQVSFAVKDAVAFDDHGVTLASTAAAQQSAPREKVRVP